MKTSAILCAVLAGTFGLGSVASAQSWRGDQNQSRDNRSEQRQDHRADRQPDRRDDRSYRQGYQASVQQPRYVQPNYGYQQRNYSYQQPAYNQRYDQPTYRSGERFQRGAYLPPQYRQRGYYVSDWHSHRGMYAPPRGYQWVNVNGEFLLVALATGLIANALLN
jgi:Ni/Co efflux regulator RcnB